ncbi:hypothetical protein F2Q69_00018692 [Brassica cretica]|uniref:Uncharacterized protein n=1 Tax=Brassica cretica TaxID=69181 RepID=A0A8S9Q7H9_BRACR|nr:hypothetical protein F2Q69_00018692 [Brassica cretica]
MLPGSTPGGSELPILSSNAVLGVGPCLQPRAGRSRAWSLSRRKDIVERQDFPPSRAEKFDDVN